MSSTRPTSWRCMIRFWMSFGSAVERAKIIQSGNCPNRQPRHSCAHTALTSYPSRLLGIWARRVSFLRLADSPPWWRLLHNTASAHFPRLRCRACKRGRSEWCVGRSGAGARKCRAPHHHYQQRDRLSQAWTADAGSSRTCGSAEFRGSIPADRAWPNPGAGNR
jgi:hypothetical protein